MTAETRGGEPEPRPNGRSTRRYVVGAIALLAVGAFVALLVLGLTARSVDRSIDSAIARGELEQAPEFTLPVLANGEALGKREGDELSLSELRGRPVILNFWASWCDPCRREAPILEDAWSAGRARGAVVLGVDVQDLTSNAREFIAKFKQTYPHVRDKGEGTYRRYGLTGLPETYFLDRAGRVRAHWVGEIDADQMADGLELILSPPSR